MVHDQTVPSDGLGNHRNDDKHRSIALPRPRIMLVACSSSGLKRVEKEVYLIDIITQGLAFGIRWRPCFPGSFE